MESDYLILRRALAFRPSGEWNDDDYDVLCNGVVVGRIMQAAAVPVWACRGCGRSRSETTRTARRRMAMPQRARPRWRRLQRAGGTNEKSPGRAGALRYGRNPRGTL